MLTQILLAVAAAVICSVSAQEPEILDEIWPEVKPVGRTARLNCTIANKKQHKVTWQHMDSGEIISLDKSIDLSINPIEGGKRKYEVQVRNKDNRITFMLIIRRLRQQDAGKYRCYVKIQGLHQEAYPSKIGILTVQVAPTIRPAETTAVMIVDEGADANLTCAATGIPAPNITWIRSDGGFLPTGGAQFRGAIMHLANTTVQMGGVYRCVADNNIRPPAQHLASLLVFNRPVVRVVQDSVGQAQNRRFNAKLECIVNGYPEASVRWEKIVNGGRFPINDNDKYEVNKQTTDNQNLKANEQWYTLKVKNVQANDYTEYFCIGSNRKGQGEASIIMFETTECQGYDCPSLPSSKATGVKVPLVAMVILALVHLTSLHLVTLAPSPILENINNPH